MKCKCVVFFFTFSCHFFAYDFQTRSQASVLKKTNKSQELSDKFTRKHTSKTFSSLAIKNKVNAACLSVRGNAQFCENIHVRGNATIDQNVLVEGNETIDGTLTIHTTPQAQNNNFLTINSNGLVTESTLSTTPLIFSGCTPGPITIGTSDATPITLATNGCTPRLIINSSGNVTITTPDSGVALTINGGGETITAGDLNIVAGNIIMPSATPGSSTTTSNGLIEMGGTNPSTTNVTIFEAATRNFFAGNYSIVPTVSGTDNISIGRISNNTLTTGSNGISIGNAARATANDSIAIGGTARTTIARTIIVGSSDSTSTGNAPSVGAANAIAIGSASGTLAGAAAGGLAAIALGGTGGVSGAATANGARSIAFGTNSTSSGATSIAIGSASGGGGQGATASNTNGIAIGSANGALRGANATGLNSMAIGSSGGTFAGASTTGARALGIGVGVTSGSANGIAIGSASGTAGGLGANTIAGEANCIAIGSANGAQRAANVTNESSIAVGGSDGVLPGASTNVAFATVIGANANATGANSVVIGSASGVAGGTGPRVTGGNGISIGSANAATVAPTAGTMGIAIGGADGTAAGAASTGIRSVALGTNATASANMTVAVGSGSGAGGAGAAATTANAISIGSANAGSRGSLANNTTAVAIGSAALGVLGATASGTRSVAIGNGANTAQADAILLGNAAATAVRVGIGTSAPTAKLHVVGPAGVPVVNLTAGSVALTSAPLFVNLTTGALVDRLTINGSNQVFRAVSSKRYKENFRNIHHILARVYALKAQMFDYKQENGGAKDHIGFVAEEVAQLLPSCVNYDEDGSPRSIKYECFHGLEIQALQEHHKKLQKNRDILQEHAAIIRELLKRMKLSNIIEDRENQNEE